MIKVDGQFIKNLLGSEVIGSGKDRSCHRIKDKIYKKTFSKFDGILNIKEYTLYQTTKESFLCPILDISENYRIIEVAECESLDKFVDRDNEDFELSSFEYYDADIRDVVEHHPQLKKYINYSWDDVEKFVHDNRLDPMEFYTCFNWLICKETKTLVCCDFADTIKEVREVA